MKNYNGSQPSSSLPEHHSSLKSPQNSQLRSVLKNPFTPEENFTVQDLKQEYNRALGYIDKLKSDQTNLKSTLKLNPETAYEEENFSSPKSFHSQNNKKKSSRDNERRLMDLEEENEELKGQLETAMARVAKLHRENKSLQERSVNQDSQAVNKELFNEVRAFQQEVKVLTARIQELEEDNIKLLKQRERVQQARAPQKPSQSLLRYINYVFKLIGSTPRSSFSRSCFEERFPKNINVNEILESGDFEQVLLKSFKYITDLLINLNSLPTEESIPKIAEITIDANSQYIERLGSRMVSPKSVKGETESFYRKRQPSQDGKDFEMSVEENVSGLKSPKSSRKYFEGGQMRNTVQKMGVSEENSGFKKLHSRHCSSTIGFSVRQDETADDGEMLSLRKKVTSDWESRQGNNQGLTSRNEEESTILQRRKTMDLKNVEKEIEKEVGKEMKTSRNYGKDREVKEYRSVRAEKEAIEEQYRSKYAKSKVAKQEKEDVKVKREEQEGERRNVKAYTRDQEAAQDSDREEQARYKSKGMVSPQEYRSGLVSRDQEIMEELHESGETHEENGEGKDKQEMWDRKREQLVRLSRKSSSNQNGVDSEYRGKDYSTFRVSFGRTESKAMKSLSPESKAFAGIMDVPRKKRVDQIGTKFDVITGGEGKPVTPSSVKSGNGKTIKFMLDEGSSKGLVSQRSKEIGKSFSMEKSGIEEAATPKKR